MASTKHISSDNNGVRGALDITMTTDEYPSGTFISLDLSTASNTVKYTLPALERGLEYTFLVNATAGTDVTLTVSAPSAVLEGVAICDNGTEDITGTNFIIAATKALLGTRIDVVSDGTLWYMKAYCKCVVADVSTT